MRRAIVEGRTPNLLALHYNPAEWRVESLFLFPRFVITLSIIDKRRPLSPSARRHGWVGCDFALDRLPVDAKITLVGAREAVSPQHVREQYAALRPLERLRHESRGWTMDVLHVVRELGKREFQLSEVYESREQLACLHPHNRHIEPKIRQQLQRLRDRGFLEFLGPGRYRLKR